MSAAGLQCGFGELLGAETLTAVRDQGLTIVRIDVQDTDLPKTTALAQEVLDAGLQPLAIIRRVEQMAVLPEGALVELGNEPDLSRFGWSRAGYLAEARKCVYAALVSGQRLYVGVVSNLNRRGFDFLSDLPWNEWPDRICASIHRYPDGDSPRNPHKGCRSRDDEIEKLRHIVGSRRALAVTEVGYHDSPSGWSESMVAAHMAWERQFFDAHGFELVVAFQINDGPPENRTSEAHFGFRRFGTGEWKPVASAFTGAL